MEKKLGKVGILLQGAGIAFLLPLFFGFGLFLYSISIDDPKAEIYVILSLISTFCFCVGCYGLYQAGKILKRTKLNP